MALDTDTVAGSALGALFAALFVVPWVRRHLKIVWRAVHRLEKRIGLRKSETPDFSLGPEEITKRGRMTPDPSERDEDT